MSQQAHNRRGQKENQRQKQFTEIVCLQHAKYSDKAVHQSKDHRKPKHNRRKCQDDHNLKNGGSPQSGRLYNDLLNERKS